MCMVYIYRQFVREARWTSGGHLGVDCHPILVGVINTPNHFINWSGLVVWKPISTNPRLNFNPGFYINLYKRLLGIIFAILFRASNNRILDKKDNTDFFVKYTFTSEIRSHINPGLSQSSFEQEDFNLRIQHYNICSS